MRDCWPSLGIFGLFNSLQLWMSTDFSSEGVIIWNKDTISCIWSTYLSFMLCVTWISLSRPSFWPWKWYHFLISSASCSHLAAILQMYHCLSETYNISSLLQHSICIMKPPSQMFCILVVIDSSISFLFWILSLLRWLLNLSPQIST